MKLLLILFYHYFSWRYRLGKARTLTVGALKRTYFVYRPKAAPPSESLPVVVAVHGATMNGPMMAWMSQLNGVADRESFLVVYPDGTGANRSYTWNAGNCCGDARKNQVDDVGFFRALLADLIKRDAIDPKRIFVTGISNGAMMTYRIAAELAGQIAAIAPVAGPSPPVATPPSRPMPIIHFHGTMDQFTPYNGGKGPKSLFQIDYLSVEQTISMWVLFNQCRSQPEITPVKVAEGDLAVTKMTYGNGLAQSEVQLFKIDGGGHTWPGRKPFAKFMGQAVLSLGANQLMWQFFQRHPLP